MHDIKGLKGKLARLRDWLKEHRIPPRLTFYLLGIASTIWFLIRVIPKPSRATYPCMRVAAPFMSGFVIYLLSLGGITLALRKARQNIVRARYIAGGSFILVALLGMVFAVIHNSQEASALAALSTGPDDGPNQPMGTAVGTFPGRVVWAWDSEATDENCQGYYFNPQYTNQEVVGRMFSESVKKLAGESKIPEAWDAIFRTFNQRKHQHSRGYTPGEKIFIKINQTTGRGRLSTEDREAGNYDMLSSSPKLDGPPYTTCQTTPFVVLELLRHLVNHCGISQSDIAIGDPQNPTLAHNYVVWAAEFPDIVYTDRMFGTHGRTLIQTTPEDRLYYSDKINTDKLYDIIVDADYMINVANFKAHGRAGITLGAKNHFGSQARQSANHLHYSLVAPIISGVPTNSGYHNYRVLVDLMGSKYLGRNTLFFIVDGLYGGGSTEGGPPVKYFMAPFNNDWCNSIFMSEDQVAIESVCYDFLRNEWNGINKHSPSNNRYESMASVNGVDDYLHQAADRSNWPEGIIYDPDNSGKPIPSLGMHEHWNDPGNKQYSRNLGKASGIELVGIPTKIVGPRAARKAAKRRPVETESVVEEAIETAVEDDSYDSEVSKFTTVEKRSFSRGPIAKAFYSGFIDEEDCKWFLTDQGIAFSRFSYFDRLIEAPEKGVRKFALQSSPEGSKVWFASPKGVIEADMPYDAGSDVKVYNTENSSLPGDSVFDIVTGTNKLQWFATEGGVSAMFQDKWLLPSYDDQYPEGFFEYYPITTMAANPGGDTLFVATRGAGVGRFLRNEVDGISGASPYAQWGPCVLPSDNVFSVFVNGDIQWYGTDEGLARHEGHDYMKGWTAYTTEDGLVDNFVQTIAMDHSGKLWVGTQGGISVMEDSGWISYTTRDGLVSNNILSIVCDKTGDVYIGTDKGFMIFNNGALICFQ